MYVFSVARSPRTDREPVFFCFLSVLGKASSLKMNRSTHWLKSIYRWSTDKKSSPLFKQGTRYYLNDARKGSYFKQLVDKETRFQNANFLLIRAEYSVYLKRCLKSALNKSKRRSSVRMIYYRFKIY